jgi:chromosome segregation ATPase
MENNNDNKRSIDGTFNKSDMETIIKVNNKAIELQNETSEQYEEMISLEEKNAEKIEKLEDEISDLKKMSEKIEKGIEEISKTEFKILILLTSGIVSLIMQIVSLLVKK